MIRTMVCLLSLLVATLLTACGPAPQTGKPKLRIAYGSEVDFEHLPSLMVVERLRAQGYEVVTTFYAQSEMAAEALARGDEDLLCGPSRTYWAAAAKGADMPMIVEMTANAWSLYSTSEIRSCADLQGRRLAVHSEGGLATALVNDYVRRNCPGTEPLVLILPGSATRAAALMAREIDATPLELADAVQLTRQAPEEFHVLADFAQDLPDLVTKAVHVNGMFAKAYPEVVTAFVKELVTVHRELADDPEQVLPAARTHLKLSEGDLQAVLAAYVRIGAWDVNGGLTSEAVGYSLSFFQTTGSLDTGLDEAHAADLHYLDEALAALGRR
ncbi:MAG: ABC transporter substrate-binding protein [Anaerolineae bacterium]